MNWDKLRAELKKEIYSSLSPEAAAEILNAKRGGLLGNFGSLGSWVKFTLGSKEPLTPEAIEFARRNI